MSSPREIAQRLLEQFSGGSAEEAVARLRELSISISSDIDRKGKACFGDALAQYCLDNELWDIAIQALSTKKSEKAIDMLSSFDKGVKEALDNNTDRALYWFCQSIAEKPDNAAALRNIAVLLKRKGNLRDAQEFIEKYLALKPACPHGLNTYATIRDAVGDSRGAIEALRKALEKDPLNTNACSNLAHQYHVLSKLDLAYVYSCKALTGKPDDLSLWLGHQTYVNRICSFAERKAIDIWKLCEGLPSEKITPFMLQCLTHAESDDENKRIAKLLRDWKMPRPEKASHAANSHAEMSTSESKYQLKVGIVSGDFRDHSVARFIWPIFSGLNRDEFSVIAYSTCHSSDSWQERFRTRSDLFYDISDMSEYEFAEQVHSDEIDILFDLTGFTKGSRTYMFANRMAPVQIAWLGFPGTTGLANMDFLFLDRHLAPRHQEFIIETPLITPGSSICFTEMEEIRISHILPEDKRGYLTFGSLNNTYKMTPACIGRWAAVMSEFKDSKFLFVRREFDSAILRENLSVEFQKHGIDGSRLIFYNNRKEGRHYLDCYNEIDITLDTYPVTGGTTTIDALWMGVPVIALEGKNIHQRVCSSILKHVGHESWIGSSDTEFIQIAIRIGHDKELRSSLRQDMRNSIKDSILFDSARFVRDFERTLKEAYRLKQCQQETPV